MFYYSKICFTILLQSQKCSLTSPKLGNEIPTYCSRVQLYPMGPTFVEHSLMHQTLRVVSHLILTAVQEVKNHYYIDLVLRKLRLREYKKIVHIYIIKIRDSKPGITDSKASNLSCTELCQSVLFSVFPTLTGNAERQNRGPSLYVIIFSTL